jgi:hypothetical protein
MPLDEFNRLVAFAALHAASANDEAMAGAQNQKQLLAKQQARRQATWELLTRFRALRETLSPEARGLLEEWLHLIGQCSRCPLARAKRPR